MGGGQSVGKKRTIGGFGGGGFWGQEGKVNFWGKLKKDGVGRKFRIDLQLSYYTFQIIWTFVYICTYLDVGTLLRHQSKRINETERFS